MSRVQRKSENSYHEGVVEIDGIRQSGDFLKRGVVEPGSDFFRIRHAYERYGEQCRNERKPVRSRRPRISEIVGFADFPKKEVRSEKACEEQRVEPVRVPNLFHFRPNGHASGRHSEKEMQSEQERIVRWKPCRDRSFAYWERNALESEMRRNESGRRRNESGNRIFFRQLHDQSHYRDDEQSSGHVERYVPKGAVEFGWKKRRRMDP